MKKILFGLLIFSIIISCQSVPNKDQGLEYTEYINSKDLVEQVAEQYPSGQKKAVVYRESDDVEQQPVKEVHFFENGNIQVEGTLLNGQRHGTWTFYHDNGKVWSTGKFIKGKSEGLFEIYDKKGQIKFKYHYKNDEIVKEEYFIDGKPYKTVDKKKTNDSHK